MREKHKDQSLTAICRIYGVTRQAYYFTEAEGQRSSISHLLTLTLVKGIREEISGIGARKMLFMIEPELGRHNIKLGRDQFFDLLRFYGLLVRRRKRKARTTDSFHWLRKYPNLIKRLQVTGPEQLWVSDITYIRTRQGFSYLSLITDTYSRKIVGYALSRTLEVEGCLEALKMALSIRQYKDVIKKLIHHSDRGLQYCSSAYTKMLKDAKIRISMTQTGSPYDNALAERVNCTIKNDYFPGIMYRNHKQASEKMDQIVLNYNEKRPHQSINYLTPEVAHTMQGPIAKRWKKYYKRKINKIEIALEAEANCI